jgi:hypothetical protein
MDLAFGILRNKNILIKKWWVGDLGNESMDQNRDVNIKSRRVDLEKGSSQKCKNY